MNWSHESWLSIRALGFGWLEAAVWTARWLSLVFVMFQTSSLATLSLLAAWHPCSVKYHKGTYLNFWNFSMVYVEGLGKAMVWLLASRSMGGSCMVCVIDLTNEDSSSDDEEL